MNTQEIAKKIKEDGSKFNLLVDGKVENTAPLSSTGAVKGYLDDMCRKYPTALIGVQQLPDGASMSVESEVVASPPIVSSPTPIVPMQGLSGFPETGSYVYTMQQSTIDKQDRIIEKLTTTCDRLKEENSELKIQKGTFDRERELYEKQKDVEKSGGLSGVVDTLGEKPELITALAGALSTIMNRGAALPVAGPQAPGTGGGTPMTGPSAKYAAAVSNWLKEQPEQVGQVFYLLSQSVSEYPDILEDINNLIPQKA